MSGRDWADAWKEAMARGETFASPEEFLTKYGRILKGDELEDTAPHVPHDDEPPSGNGQWGKATIPLSVTDWLARDLPEPDFLMGSWLSTTSRALLAASTGLGKTNFSLALTISIAAGMDFLHWRARRPARVLFVDGEMSRRLMKVRLADAVRRLGAKPNGLHVLSGEDIGIANKDGFQPLNTLEGQAIIEGTIDRISNVDLIVFDNIMSLISGDMKDEEGWRDALPWIRSLTRRSIGQIWVHHTGHDESRGYGTKTREWQMDTVAHMTAVNRDDTDISFDLEFRKARERTPDTRADFEAVRIALVDDRWTFTTADAKPRGRASPVGLKYLDALTDALASDAATMVQGKRSVSREAWKAECFTLGLLDKDASANVNTARFSKYRLELIAANLVACEGDFSWLR